MILGYQGMIELAMRSGQVSSIFAHPVYESDEFHYRLGLDPDIHHIPSADADRESGKLTHVYAVARIKGADPVFVVLSKAQVDARKSRSATAGKSFSPWQSDYDAMALKTAVRALFKWLPKSSEMMARIETLEKSGDEGNQTQFFSDDVSEGLDRVGLSESVIDEETGEVIDEAVNGGA
jgi:recombination protein RecT